MKRLIRAVAGAAATAALAAVLAPGAGAALTAQSLEAQADAFMPGLVLPAPPPAPAGRLIAPRARSADLPFPTQTEPASGQFFTEPDDGRGPILDVINAAQSTITLTIYEISDSQIVDALIAAQQRGVSVSVLYNHYSFTKGDPNAATIAKLQAAGVQTEPAPRTFTITHQKTLVADGSTAVIMSLNLTSSYFSTSRDFGYVTTDPGLVSEIEGVFQADWEGQDAGVSQPALVWSPENSRQKITSVIDGAQKTLDIYAEELLDKASMSAIAAAAQRGVAVRVICADLSDNGGPNDNQPGVDQVNAAGGQAKVGTNLYIHAKMVLADYGTPQANAYMGSENFSSTSLDKNRELGILLTDPAILSSIETTFQSDWNQ